jgi:hypothetical protein
VAGDAQIATIGEHEKSRSRRSGMGSTSTSTHRPVSELAVATFEASETAPTPSTEWYNPAIFLKYLSQSLDKRAGDGY